MRCKSKKGAEEIRPFELSGKEIFSNYDKTKSEEVKRKRNGSKKNAHRGQSARNRSQRNQGNIKQWARITLHAGFIKIELSRQNKCGRCWHQRVSQSYCDTSLCDVRTSPSIIQTLDSIKCPLCDIHTLRDILEFHVQDCMWNWECFEKYTFPSPFALTVTSRLSKDQVQVRDRKKAKKTKEQDKEAKDYETTLLSVLWAGAVWCGDLGLLLILYFINGRAEVVQRKSVCRQSVGCLDYLHCNNLSLPKRLRCRSFGLYHCFWQALLV